MPAHRHPRRRFPSFTATVWLVVCAVAIGHGIPPVARAAEVGGESPDAVKAVEPDLYYLRDDAGRLVPVPGFRYRDFVDLLRIRDGLPGIPQPPAAVLERVEITGDLGATGGDTCQLTVRVSLRQTRAGWSRVPLELRGMVVTTPPRHEGEGRLIVDVDQRGGGYEAWLEAAVDSQHTLTLVGLVPVARGPNAETLRLAVPRATASLVRLATPRVAPRVDVQPAGAAIRVAAAAEAATGSVVECAGVAGPTTILIGAAGETAWSGVAPPQAVVESVVRIDGTLATTTASIQLEGLGPEPQDLRIALPPGSRIERVADPATLVEVVGSAETPQAVVRVRPDAAGRAVVDVVCERPIEMRSAPAVEALGFAVAGIPAWRQRGRMSVVVEGDWQVEWEDSGGNRRVDPPVAARRPGFVAAFAYDAQPATLPLRVRPRGSRVVVEPAYRYAVGATRIALVAKLRVVVRGAPASRVVLGLEGWNVDEVGPTTLVDAAAVTTEGGRLVIPFAQPLSGEATIEARCSLPIDRTQAELAWKLPVPRADLVGPAEVTITSDSDIEILPEVSAMTGLVRQVAPAPRSGESPLLAYRVDGTEGRFAARRRFLARRVDASIMAQTTVGPQRIRVEETIRFTVANVPLEFVDLAVPRRIVDDGSLEVRQAGDLLNPFEVSAPADAPEGLAALRVMLANPLLGTGDVSISYGVPMPDVPAAATVGENLPLVLPTESRIVRQSVAVTASDQYTVDLRGTAWTRDTALPAAGPSRVWQATSAESEVPLAVALRSESGTIDTTVEAAWYETRLLPDRHDETFTCAITSSTPEVRLMLPAGFGAARAAGAQAARFSVDGVGVVAAEDADGTVRVPLPAAGRSSVLVIEMSRPRRAADLLPGLPAWLVLEPPRFPTGTVLRRFYWELRMESDEHVVVPPVAWTSQQRWRWGAFGPEYAPLVSHTAIAEWIAAAAGRRVAAPDMPVAERRVVYAGVGDPGTGRVWLAPTWFLVLTVSGAALALGLAIVYGRVMRRVSTLVSIGAVAALGAAFIPDLLPLIGLAALPGILLALLAAGLRWVVDRRTAAPGGSGFTVSPDSSTRFVPAASVVIAATSPAASAAGPGPGRGGRE